MRVPSHLHKHYGKDRIRQSLNTKDEHKAVREAEKLARKYQAEFKVLTDGAKATPDEAALAGKALASTTVRRTITNLSAVTAAAIREPAVVRTNPTKTANTTLLIDIIDGFKPMIGTTGH